MNELSLSKVALYWDFENLHAVLADKVHGVGAYRENRFVAQPVFVQLAPVIDYAASLGDLIINRAYGNWQWFHKYRDTLNQFGVDLIQLFPRGTNMKNSADIRMALDALSDIHYHPHISHVVVVSSDSDFISLAQKTKQAGKTIVGVGIEGFSNKFWVSSCNEFKFYEGLCTLWETTGADRGEKAPVDEESIVEDAPTARLRIEDARSALLTAMTQLVARCGENYVACGGLKLVMKRLLPALTNEPLDVPTSRPS
jgi:hypothetical protein